ncbi:hypothetical protein MHYP_G00214720 [Metynnis hypsauchen]
MKCDSAAVVIKTLHSMSLEGGCRLMAALQLGDGVPGQGERGRVIKSQRGPVYRRERYLSGPCRALAITQEQRPPGGHHHCGMRVGAEGEEIKWEEKEDPDPEQIH